MPSQHHRFSRRFLAILIFVSSVAIILLSQTGEPEDSLPRQPSSSSQQPGHP